MSMYSTDHESQNLFWCWDKRKLNSSGQNNGQRITWQGHYKENNLLYVLTKYTHHTQDILLSSLPSLLVVANLHAQQICLDWHIYKWIAYTHTPFLIIIHIHSHSVTWELGRYTCMRSDGLSNWSWLVGNFWVPNQATHAKSQLLNRVILQHNENSQIFRAAHACQCMFTEYS